MLSAVGLFDRMLTARANKKQLIIISLLIKIARGKGYDPAMWLNSRHPPLSIKKIPESVSMRRIGAPFTACYRHHSPIIVAKLVSVLRFDFTSKKPI